ncbi:MAG: hypothetical protein JXC33_12190 [Deltaproteobacteria bacterium]|nr:hypothetical protein [Deltaproteobacteria bacterium]
MHTRKSFYIGITFFCIIGCAILDTKQPTLYDTRSGLFSKQFTTGEIRAVKAGFKAYPFEYSEEFGNLLLWRIHSKNQAFSRQLVKLPELNDGITPDEARALHTMYVYIKGMQAERKKKPGSTLEPGSRSLHIINEMTQDGLTNDSYRYSPSLEAFLWLIMDGHFDAQLFEAEYVNSLTFTKTVWGTMKGPRWEDFDVVTDRVNNPELLHYYITKNISYKKGHNTQSAKQVFSRGFGDCYDVAFFGKYLLERAGYKTTLRQVRYTNDQQHGLLVIQKDGHYLLVVDFTPEGNTLSGPYRDISQVDNTLSRGKRIYHRSWGSDLLPGR